MFDCVVRHFTHLVHILDISKTLITLYALDYALEGVHRISMQVMENFLQLKINYKSLLKGNQLNNLYILQRHVVHLIMESMDFVVERIDATASTLALIESSSTSGQTSVIDLWHTHF